MKLSYSPLYKEICGWLILFAVTLFLIQFVPQLVDSEVTLGFFFLLGLMGFWRYGMAVLTYIRGMLFIYIVYPRHRKRLSVLGDQVHPDKLFVLATSFRIDTQTTIDVYRSIMEEAKRCPYPVTIVASLVEYADEALVRQLWRSQDMPHNTNLKIVRIKGSGKRDGLAYGFRSIANEMPTERSVVAVVDGDTVITENAFLHSAKFFALFPNLGGLTTDEHCEPRFASYLLREFHRMRFAQRQINMASMALSKRVLTMTGRMSMFRATVAGDRDFINLVQDDNLEHWRLGSFKFLTGDDKSTWFSLMRGGWDTYYVPDVRVVTMEYAPHKNFITATRLLLFRWSGNSLRQNMRATKLGPDKLGWFAYWTLWDQRIVMWTTLFGPLIAIIASIKYSPAFLMIYIAWVLITRIIKTLILLPSGHRVGPLWPMLMFYYQLAGSIIKIDVLFNLDKQSWTRQKTKLEDNLSQFRARVRTHSSMIAKYSAVCCYVAVLYPIV